MKRLMSRIFLSLSLALFAIQAKAVCPLCTVAVVAGVGLSRWLGVDDTISGVWIGGLIVSLIVWTINWMNKKQWRFKGRKILITLAYYLMVVWPLYETDIVGHPLNRLWGIDKLILGVIAGSVAFFAGSITYNIMKAKNNNHAHYPFEKVVMPVVPLVILSIIFFFITH